VSVVQESGQGKTVSPEQREKFDRDGYLVIDSPGAAEEVIDGVLGDLEHLFQGGGRDENGVFYAWHRIMDAWRISANVRALALAPRVLATMQELYGRKPKAFQTLNFRLGTEQPVHSDTIHFNSQPAGYMCGAWIALEDIDMDNGPVVYYPGSHKLPEITLQDVGENADELQYTEYIAELIERENLRPEYATIKKGQVFLWAANLLHGGSPQRDKNRTRLSQVTHFYFEGCKYWTPIRSTPSHTEWRRPVWITEDFDLNAEDPKRITEIARGVVPTGATVLVVSKGDERLLELNGRWGWHFPQADDGDWAGYYPADTSAVIAHLEELRARGAEYLLLPGSAFWWLEHYEGLGAYLEDHCKTVLREDDCLIFALSSP
jgi:hypothetical protein